LKDSSVHVDGKALSTAREKAKISVSDAASACSLSSQQILSLETNSDTGFFNNKFKIICARKYINFLKINPTDIILSNNNDSTSEETDLNIADEETSAESQHRSQFAQLKIEKNIKTLVAFCLIGIVLLALYFSNQHDESENILNESNSEIEIDNGSSSDETEEDQISLFESADENSAESIEQDEQEQKLTVLNDSDFEQVNETSCNNIFESNEIQNYRTPNVPDKPDNYVHIKSNQDISLCIQSSDGDVKLFTVGDSNPLTFRGQAPFTLHIPNPDGVQVFFQGWQVWLNPNYQIVKLNSYQDPNLGSLE
jgi:cytoskeletal protein RodZ